MKSYKTLIEQVTFVFQHGDVGEKAMILTYIQKVNNLVEGRMQQEPRDKIVSLTDFKKRKKGRQGKS